MEDTNNDALLEAFWVRARNAAGIYPLEAVLGQDEQMSLRPPVFSFGDSVELADRLCQLVIDGKKTATSSWRDMYSHEGAELPEVGELSIVCDGAGRPRVLLRLTAVETVSFAHAGPEIAAAEGEGTFEEWREAHDAFFRRECEEAGIEFDPNGDIVVEHFEALYSL